MLDFAQHLDETVAVPDVGPGWEYYLDKLVAAHLGDPEPAWHDYYPGLKAYYEDLVAASAPGGGDS